MNDQVAFYRDKVAKQREENSAFEATVAQRAAQPEPKPFAISTPVGLGGFEPNPDRNIGSVSDFVKSVPAALAGLSGDAFEIAELLGIAVPKNPFMSTREVQEEVGVEQGLASFMGEMVSPLPGEAAPLLSLFIGPIGAERLGGQILKGYNKFKKSGSDALLDAKTYKETGWFNWFDKKPRYHLSDADVPVNSGLLADKVKAKNLEIGGTAKVEMTLGELWPHNKLYEAYPTLKSTRVIFDVRQTDRAGNYVVEYLPKARVKAEARTNQITGTSRIRFFNLDSPEQMRELVIHEAEHLVQSLEGFGKGAVEEVFDDVFVSAKKAQIEKRLYQDRMDGTLTDDVTDVALYEYSNEIAKKYGLSQFGAEDMVYKAVNEIDPTDQLALATRAEEIYLSEAGVILEDLGAKGLTDEMIERMPRSAALRLARSRYLREGGEVEARLQQYLKDTREGQIDMSPDLVTKIDGPVQPDKVVAKEARAGPIDEAESVHDLYIEPTYLLSKGKIRVEYLRNPTERELRTYIKKHDPINLRYMASDSEGLLVWDGKEALHDDFVKGLGIQNAGMDAFSGGNRSKYDIKEWGDVDPADAPMVLLGRMGD